MYTDGDTQNNLASDILKDTEGNPGANSITMTWAEANGRLNTANSQNWDIPSQATNTGCYAYRGKSGKDEPGSWRVPNSRELSMILIFVHELEKDFSETGFEALNKNKAKCYSYGYWSSPQASKKSWDSTEASGGAIDANYGLTIYHRSKASYNSYNRLRCIKDIP